ncbi:hypothetical protein F444_22800 [Phytophthora nicotianae P1976]|uniref:Uncharacterized protein n=1 Tax=Phytophthora nicotianae P1976 TaxID=1317066 RepID=A0A080YWQ2_PHYNI|nr:hypothetical protein F444_22800 [Phytophthora nicotianae P1976]
MPNDEASIAMSFGIFDMLTVIDTDKIAIQGVAWVKRKIMWTGDTEVRAAEIIDLTDE